VSGSRTSDMGYADSEEDGRMGRKASRRWLVTWNVVVTSMLLILGSVQLLPKALATIGDFTELLQGTRLELKGSSGYGVLLQGWNASNDEAVYVNEHGGLWLGYETQTGVLDIMGSTANALLVRQVGQVAPMFAVQASSGGTGNVQIRADNSAALKVVDDSTNGEVFSVNTIVPGVYSSAPLFVDTIGTHAVGGDLVFELR